MEKNNYDDLIYVNNQLNDTCCQAYTSYPFEGEKAMENSSNTNTKNVEEIERIQNERTKNEAPIDVIKETWNNSNAIEETFNNCECEGVKFDRCENAKCITKRVNVDPNGKILNVNVKICNVCRGRRVVIGVLVCENNKIKFMKVKEVLANSTEINENFTFLIDDSRASRDYCYNVKVLAHYVF